MRASAGFELHPEPQRVLDYLAGRFGLDASVFAEHRFWHRPGSPAIWIAHRDCLPPPGAKVDALGMLVMREPPPGGKPTSVFLQRFAESARRNVYTLSEAEAAVYLRGGSVPIVPVDEKRGYCIVRTEKRVLGCGKIEGETLHSELPRSWAEGLEPG